MDHAEETVAAIAESGRHTCPVCAHQRKKKNQKTLSVDIFPDYTLYDCHHCDFRGRINHQIPDVLKPTRQRQQKVVQLPTKLNRDHELIQKFFSERGITLIDMSNLPITTGRKKYRDLGWEEVDSIGFIYGDRKNPEAIKWRPLDGRKAFTQDGSAKSFYGLDQLPEDTKDIILVEGECDWVANMSVGIPSLSCPNGAPEKVSERGVDPTDDKKYKFLWHSRELLDAAEKLVLAVDNDEAGDALAEEIARRVGRERCWRVKFPDDMNDPNEVLERAGEAMLREAYRTAEAMPLVGVYSARTYSNKLHDAYLNGYGSGESTGLENIDTLFTVAPGLYVVTGMPGMGKSEFIDQVMMNLSMRRSWKWAVASFENPPHIHQSKLAEKFIGKPFREGLTPRMKKAELEQAEEFLDEHFLFLESKDGSLPTIDNLLKRIRAAIYRSGCRGVCVDPYNYIQRPHDISEHQFITDMLTKVVSFAKAYDIAFFFVAHPAKMYPREDGSYGVPKGMNISGSAAWFAKSDIGLTVHRSTAGVEIHNWKARFKWIGQVGMELLEYDVPTGRYFVPRDWGQDSGDMYKRSGSGWSKADFEAVKDFDDEDLPF